MTMFNWKTRRSKCLTMIIAMISLISGVQNSKEFLDWELVLSGEVIQLNASRDSSLVVNASHVLLDRIFSDVKMASDVFVGHSVVHNRRYNLKLPRR